MHSYSACAGPFLPNPDISVLAAAPAFCGLGPSVSSDLQSGLRWVGIQSSATSFLPLSVRQVAAVAVGAAAAAAGAPGRHRRGRGAAGAASHHPTHHSFRPQHCFPSCVTMHL